MTRARQRVGVIFGGRSGEHGVSVQSARGIVSALDPERFEAVPIGIDREGRWLRVSPRALLADSNYAGEVGSGALVSSDGDAGALARSTRGELGDQLGVDVFFPIVHGPLGEDGSLQGLLEMAGVPYVGCGVLGSAVGMDKDVAKRLLRDAGLPVVPALVARSSHGVSDELCARVATEIGFPCFVKPANLGSSVGISKVKRAEDLPDALRLAFGLDRKLLVERGIDAREIETAVLGTDRPEVSVPGEIVPRHEFYSYEAKYLDADGAELRVPALLDAEQTRVVQAMSLRAFEALELEGLARVDFFLERGTGAWFVNEVNTLPGFTAISMYARMWEHAGLSFRELVSRLVDLAVERHAQRRALSSASPAAP